MMQTHDLNSNFERRHPYTDRLTLNFITRAFDVVKCNPSNRAIIKKSMLLYAAPLTQTNSQKFCKYCSHPWNDGFFTLKVQPKPVLGKRIRKILRKSQETPGSLSQFQQKLLQFVNCNQGNKLVLTCLNCKKRTIKQMPKCTYNKPNKRQEKEEEKTVKIKKKKKKDIFVGLNREVVLKSALLDKNSSIKSSINLNASKRIANYTKTSNLSNLNVQKNNFELSASNQKSKVQQTSNPGNTYKPKNVQSIKKVSITPNDNPRGNSDSKSGSFFHKLEMNRKLEIQKKNNNMKLNEKMRKMLSTQMAKNKKSNKRELKNFLQEFGNPANS